MNTEIVSHIESNAESNAMVILRKKQNKTKNQNLTKQLNSVNLISAYIKFSAEFSKLRRDLRILRLGVHTKEQLQQCTLDPGVVMRGFCREGRSGNILCDFCNTHSGHRVGGASYNTAFVLSTTKNASLASIMIYNPTLITIQITFLRGFCSSEYLYFIF